MLQATSKHVNIGQIPPGKKYRCYIFITQLLLLEKCSERDGDLYCVLTGKTFVQVLLLGAGGAVAGSENNSLIIYRNKSVQVMCERNMPS